MAAPRPTVVSSFACTTRAVSSSSAYPTCPSPSSAIAARSRGVVSPCVRVHLDGERHEPEPRDDRDLLEVLSRILGTDRLSVVAPPADDGVRCRNCGAGREPGIGRAALAKPPNQVVPDGHQGLGVLRREATADKQPIRLAEVVDAELTSDRDWHDERLDLAGQMQRVHEAAAVRVDALALVEKDHRDPRHAGTSGGNGARRADEWPVDRPLERFVPAPADQRDVHAVGFETRVPDPREAYREAVGG